MNTVHSVPDPSHDTKLGTYKEQAEAREARYRGIFNIILGHLNRFFPDTAKKGHASYFSSVFGGEVHAFLGSISIRFPADTTISEVEGSVLDWMKYWDVTVDGKPTELQHGLGLVTHPEESLLVIEKTASRMDRVINKLLPAHTQTSQGIQSRNYLIKSNAKIRITRKPQASTEE